MASTSPRYDDLNALFINCTLKPSPELSHTQGLIEVSGGIMRKQGVRTETIRAVDHDIATGVWPDMTEHGAAADAWPQLYPKVLAADILVIAGPIWLGDNSSVTKRVIERLYGCSHLLNDAGQYAYYGRVGGCLITGNEDGIKHCAMNILYSLQHLGYAIPPQADAGWIGEAGPGPSYLDPDSGGPENEFTNRNTTFMTWNLLHLARMLKDAAEQVNAHVQGQLLAGDGVDHGFEHGREAGRAHPAEPQRQRIQPGIAGGDPVKPGKARMEAQYACQDRAGLGNGGAASRPRGAVQLRDQLRRARREVLADGDLGRLAGQAQHPPVAPCVEAVHLVVRPAPQRPHHVIQAER